MATSAQATHIEYCGEHYSELMNALLNRQLHEHISKDAEEMVDKLEAGQIDVGLEATSAITGSAIEMFGPDAIMEAQGCPLCAYANIINHIADHLALKYTRSN